VSTPPAPLFDDATAAFDLDDSAVIDWDEARRQALAFAGDVAAERKQRLLFHSALEVAAMAPDRPDWIAGPWIVAGGLTELDGRAKAAGKTTLVGHLAAAVLDGVPFLGHSTTATPIVMLTEQAPASLREVLARTRLLGRDDLRLLLWRDARGYTWPDIVAAAIDESRRVGARLLVVDTLPAFAGIRGDAENDAGAALHAISPLQAAAADGLAVLVVRHERKGGGELGDSARGSSAFTGAVDVVIRLTRRPDAPRPTIRYLECLSRFDETPAELVIELTEGGFVVLGTEGAIAFDEARVGILASAPETGEGRTEPELVDAIGGKATTVGQALRHLIAAGEIERTGAGRRGSPYRYRRVPGIVSPDPSPPEGGVGGRREKAIPALDTALSVGEEMAAIFRPDDEASAPDGELEPDDPWPPPEPPEPDPPTAFEDVT
jgi:hypothetical protein